MPVWLRIPIGLIALAVGTLVLGVVSGIIGERATETPAIAFVMAGVLATAMIAVGLLLLIGVATGVGDYSERPPTMGVGVRVLLNALGYVFAFCVVALFGFFALSPAAGWGANMGGVIARTLFGLFALLFGAAALYSMGRALVRAVRGLPYDDESPSPPG